MSNLTDLQRMAAWKKLGEDCRRLLSEGYAVEADEVLDEMIERRAAWEREAEGYDDG